MKIQKLHNKQSSNLRNLHTRIYPPYQAPSATQVTELTANAQKTKDHQKHTMNEAWTPCNKTEWNNVQILVQELCESRGGRPGLSVLTSLLASVDIKLYWTMLRHWSQLVSNICQPTSEDIKQHYLPTYLVTPDRQTCVRVPQTLNDIILCLLLLVVSKHGA